MAEVEEDDPEEENVKDPNTNITSGMSFRPIVVPPRIHKDSSREVSELEPINEQSEHVDSISLEEEEKEKEKVAV